MYHGIKLLIRKTTEIHFLDYGVQFAQSKKVTHHHGKKRHLGLHLNFSELNMNTYTMEPEYIEQVFLVCLSKQNQKIQCGQLQGSHRNHVSIKLASMV